MMKLRGNKPGQDYLHVGEGPSLAGIILLLCLYLLGAVIGCYLANGSEGPGCTTREWVILCACWDGMALALALLFSQMPAYPLLPMLLLPLKGILTSAWVVWQCAGSAVGAYLRCYGTWGLFSIASLLCLLLAFLKGISMRVRLSGRERRFRAAMMLLIFLYGVLVVATTLQCQVCKWL